MPAKLHANQLFRLSAWLFALAGALATTVTCLLLVAQVLTLAFVQTSISANLTLVLTLLALVIGGSTIVLLALPRLLRDFRCPAHVMARHWTRNWTKMPSVAQQLLLLRGILLFALAIPLVNLYLSGFSRTQASTFFSASELSVFGWASAFLFLLLAAAVWFGFPLIYFKFRRQRIHRSLRHHHRGVALRSFIAAWDNPNRPIYQSCRLSRRVSRVHRGTFCVATFCLSAAASSMAIIPSEHWLNELACGAALLGLAAIWPTPQRLVAWSAKLLDPLCQNSDEYEYV